MTNYTTAEVEEALQLAQEPTAETKIKTVQFGKHLVKSQYYSPYPTGFQESGHLNVCQYCFNYYKTKDGLFAHLIDCHADVDKTLRQVYKLPKKLLKTQATEWDKIIENVTLKGQETVYRSDRLKLVRVDPKRSKLMCQNLCLFGKLFIDHKTLFYDITRFHFFLLFDKTECVGYFSKELESDEDCNLSCIIVFPCFQRKGYGIRMIELSYQLSRLEKVMGSPERPLSDLGKKSYLAYWKVNILKYLEDNVDTRSKNLSIALQTLSEVLFIKDSDLQMAFEESFEGFQVYDDSIVYFTKADLKRELENSRGMLDKFQKVPLEMVYMPSLFIKIFSLETLYSTIIIPQDEIEDASQCTLQTGRSCVVTLRHPYIQAIDYFS
ncbi:hypothetical protein MP638_007408 [Amoeboaphelidium occidentale]|nr:hypothetical protein MP638_007408 [Amoeboaphelidium occidentale]